MFEVRKSKGINESIGINQVRRKVFPFKNKKSMIATLSRYPLYRDFPRLLELTTPKPSQDSFQWMLKLVKKAFKFGITIFCIVICFLEIQALTKNYLAFDVVLSISRTQQDLIEPPNFSFCFQTLNLINASEILEKRPDITAEIRKKMKSSKDIRNEVSCIHDYSIGSEIIFNHLTVAEIHKFMPSFSKILIQCRHLNQDLTLKDCDRSYFREYFHNQQFCYEFTWYSDLSDEKASPRFSAEKIKIPGFQTSKFLSVQFNFTHIRNVGIISVKAHSSVEVPWDPEIGTLETRVSNGQFRIQSLSYHKVKLISLPAPYQSKCTNFTETRYKSQQDCIKDCSVDKFINITRKYPRNFVIRKFDRYKISYAYPEREAFQPLIQQLSENCTQLCGIIGCDVEYYRTFSLSSSKQLLPNEKLLMLEIFPPLHPDSLRKTQPTTNFEYYFASVGGTIGIWFGYSFYSSVCRVFTFAPKIFHFMWSRWLRRKNRVTMIKPTYTRYRIGY